MTARAKIRDSIVNLCKSNMNTVNSRNILPRLKFLDEMHDFPTMCIISSNEEREYLPADFSWGYLNIKVWIYVKSEDPEEDLENVLGELEDIIDSNNDLEYDSNKKITLMSLSAINTDEGILAPRGVGQVTITVQYALDRCI